MSSEKPNVQLSGTLETEKIDAERMATAYHEAGHAVMAVTLGRPVHKVTINAGYLATGGRRLGQCEVKKGRSKPTKDWLEDEALILLAGLVAEAQLTGQLCEQGAAQDLRNVRRLMLDRAGSERQLERLEQRLLDKTTHLLAEETLATAIQMIAQELYAKSTVSGRAVRHFIEQASRKK